MTLLDVGVIICIGGLALLGFKRGFARELTETFGALVAAFVAYHYSARIAVFLGISVGEKWWSVLFLVVAVFLICMIAIAIIGRLLARFVRSINLGMYDHLAGFVLGALKGGILIAVIAVGLLWLGSPGHDIVRDSRFARANLMVFGWLSEALPDGLEQKYASAVAGLKDTAEQYREAAAPFIPISTLSLPTTPASRRIRGTITEWETDLASGTVTFEIDGYRRQAGISAASFADGNLDPGLIQIGRDIEFNLTYLISKDRLYVWAPSQVAEPTSESTK